MNHDSIIEALVMTLWRETLVVGKFGELSANTWRNKIWRIAV